jgi:hypothetical protein
MFYGASVATYIGRLKQVTFVHVLAVSLSLQAKQLPLIYIDFYSGF